MQFIYLQKSAFFGQKFTLNFYWFSLRLKSSQTIHLIFGYVVLETVILVVSNFQSDTTIISWSKFKLYAKKNTKKYQLFWTNFWPFLTLVLVSNSKTICPIELSLVLLASPDNFDSIEPYPKPLAWILKNLDSQISEKTPFWHYFA